MFICFSFFHVFLFLLFLSFSFIFLHFLSFSFIFFHFVFVGCSKSDFFWASISLRFLLTVLMYKKINLGTHLKTPYGPSFPFFSYFFFLFLFLSVVHASAASTRHVMGSWVGGSKSIPETVLAQEGARQNVLNPKPQTPKHLST